MKKFLAIAYAAFLLLGLQAKSEEKFSNLPVREFYFLYEKSPNVTNLQFSTIYTVQQVRKAIHCEKIFVSPFRTKDGEGILIIGKHGQEFKTIIMLKGYEEEHWT